MEEGTPEQDPRPKLSPDNKDALSKDNVESEDVVSAAEVAKRHGVSMATVRRRIMEGKIFPGAVKVHTGFDERWFIPRAVADRLSLKDISPRVFQKRGKDTPEVRHGDDGQAELTDQALEALAGRVARLERLYLKLLRLLQSAG